MTPWGFKNSSVQTSVRRNFGTAHRGKRCILYGHRDREPVVESIQKTAKVELSGHDRGRSGFRLRKALFSRPD